MMTGEQITQALVAAFLGKWQSPSGDWRQELEMQGWSPGQIREVFEQQVTQAMAELPDEQEVSE